MSSVLQGLRRAHGRGTEMSRLRSTKRIYQSLCAARMSSRNPYLPGVLSAHDNHRAFGPQGCTVSLVRCGFIGIRDFECSHFLLFCSTANADEFYQVRMFFSQVRNEALNLWKRMVRRVEGRIGEGRIPSRWIDVGCLRRS